MLLAWVEGCSMNWAKMKKLKITSRNRKTTDANLSSVLRTFHGNIVDIWEIYFNFSLDFETIHELRWTQQIQTGNVQRVLTRINLCELTV